MHQITSRRNGFNFSLTHFFITFFLAITILGTPSSAYPVNVVCPTTAAIAEQLKQQTNIGDNTVFYSAPVTSIVASNFAHTKNGNAWADLISQDFFFGLLDECGGPEEQDKLVPRIAEAIAMASTGTAYILMSGERPPKPESIWVTREFPALQANDDINQVIQHDVDTDTESVIWNRPDDPDLHPDSSVDSLYQWILEVMGYERQILI